VAPTSKKSDPAEAEAAQVADVKSSKAPVAESGPEGGFPFSGPGTGNEAPKETTPRMPVSQVVYAESGPLNPEDAKKQVVPQGGYADSSTDPVYAALGMRTIAGEDFVGLEKADGGGKADAGSLFDDGDGSSPFVTVKEAVNEVFTYANAPDFESRRQLFTKGQQVSRARAEAIKAAAKVEQRPMFPGVGLQSGNDESKGARPTE
jgi:hypothetical protein